MSVLGIVAEFNPFHNGHFHLIKEIKSKYNFDAIICVMSGNFVQRGEPAICNKWARAKMALHAGIDLVIELPFCFATRSAYYFANGAIKLLTSTGVVTHIAFGSECEDINLLKRVSNVLSDEPEDYKKTLKMFLHKGISYPLARSKALQSYFNDTSLEPILLGSNNILGIEYLRILNELNSSVTPITVKRKGENYNSIELNEFASASAIRHALYSGKSLEDISHTMPFYSKQILSNELNQGRAPINKDTYGNFVMYKLRTMNEFEIGQIYDVGEGLEGRIAQKVLSSCNIDQLRQAIKSKRYSLTRINRILLYSLLGLTKNKVKEIDDNPLYYHILGFTHRGKSLLQDIKNNSNIPLLNRGSDVKALYDRKDTPDAKMISLDIMSTNIYSLFYPDHNQRIGAKDFTTSPVII